VSLAWRFAHMLKYQPVDRQNDSCLGVTLRVPAHQSLFNLGPRCIRGKRKLRNRIHRLVLRPKSNDRFAAVEIT
jgi:hypothetical protein